MRDVVIAGRGEVEDPTHPVLAAARFENNAVAVGELLEVEQLKIVQVARSPLPVAGRWDQLQPVCAGHLGEFDSCSRPTSFYRLREFGNAQQQPVESASVLRLTHQPCPFIRM